MYTKILSVITVCALLILGTTSCNSDKEEKSSTLTNIDDTTKSPDNSSTVFLEQSDDMGQGYIDSFIFVGESTTYHMKNRGVLSGGSNTLQVWGPKSGTLMLDASTANCRIVFPDTGEEMDIGAAIKIKQPKFIVLTFGLNGATLSISKGSEYFKACYAKLIGTLLSASPQTHVILQSCFPVAKNMDMSSYSVSASTLNRYIDTINSWSSELAASMGLAYLNTAEILKDTDGFLYSNYQVGDGYHLTREAYLEILKYIRTHGYKEKNYG